MKKNIIGSIAAAVTTTGALLFGAAPAHADVFTICPSGYEGVVGGHTTCAFADNVRRVFYASGMSRDIIAYSPATGERYEMICVGGYRANFDTGGSLIATQCFGGDNDNAEVVVW
jgi:hypothetical protein